MSKPATVTFTDGRSITYTYDASGVKLKTATTVSGVTTTTDYVSSFVYTNNALSFFSSPEGRVVKNGSNYEYQYAISDHQGNTRVVFTSAAQAPIPTLATFEGDANDQSSQFSNVTAIPFGSANHTPGGSKVVRLNQAAPVGPGLSKKVFPGDKVDMEVYSYYETASGYGTSNLALATLISSVSGALINGGPDAGGLKANGVTNALNGFGTGANQGDTQPAAFLNYILFDANYKVMDAGWQVVPATSFSKQYVSIPTITVKEAGYIFVYLSYEDQSNNYVYFDDFKVTLTPTNIIQSNEYYAFNMASPSSWTRDNATTNNFLANGGTELNTTSNLYDLEFRNYDPVLGRMHQVDPMADKYSSHTPYNYSFNSPVVFNDPSGADPDHSLYDTYVAPYWRPRPVDTSAGGAGDGGSSNGFGDQGSVVNPGFTPEVWNQIGGIVNNLWDHTNAYDGATQWTPEGGYQYGSWVPSTTQTGNSYASGINNSGRYGMWIVYGKKTTTYTFVPSGSFDDSFYIQMDVFAVPTLRRADYQQNPDGTYSMVKLTGTFQDDLKDPIVSLTLKWDPINGLGFVDHDGPLYSDWNLTFNKNGSVTFGDEHNTFTIKATVRNYSMTFNTYLENSDYRLVRNAFLWRTDYAMRVIASPDPNFNPSEDAIIAVKQAGKNSSSTTMSLFGIGPTNLNGIKIDAKPNRIFWKGSTKP